MKIIDGIRDSIQKKIALSHKNWDRYAKLFATIYPQTKFLTNPVLGPIMRKMGKMSDMETQFSQGYYAPISIDVNFKRNSQNVVLPVTLVEKLIKKSGHRVIMKGCLCRESQKCEHYPVDFGCIFIGEATHKISANGVAYDASVEESLAHLKKGAELGLVCLCVWIEGEGFGLGLSKDEHHKFLEICFCCPCCCVGLRNFKHMGPEIMQRFDTIGWKPVFSANCEKCGTCQTACTMNAITVEPDGSNTLSEDCLGCGVCASRCPQKAIDMQQVGQIKENIEDYFFGFRPDIT